MLGNLQLLVSKFTYGSELISKNGYFLSVLIKFTNPRFIEFNKACCALELYLNEKAKDFRLKFLKSFPTIQIDFLFLFLSFYSTFRRICHEDEIKFVQ